MVKVATHESFEARFEAKSGSDRSFGLVFAGFFAVLGLLPLLHLRTPHWWWLVAAGAALAVALAAPVALHPLNLLWFRFGRLLHKVVTPVIMGVLFYATITPIAVVMRMLGKTPIPLKPDRAAKSYWIARVPPGPAAESMKHQY